MLGADLLRSTRGRSTLQGLGVFGGGDMALELRPNCEYCDRDLAPASLEARICSYECTFCADCVERHLGNVCPNCGGGLAYSREAIAAFVREVAAIPPEKR